MTLLQNRADALVKVQTMDRAQLEALFGTFAPVAGRVAGALYNGDTHRVKAALLHCNPAGIVTGLKIAQVLSGAQGAVLIVDREVNRQELIANANMAGLPLAFEEADLVDKMAHRADALYSFDQLCAMAARLVGEEPGCLVCVDGGDLQELPPHTPAASLVPQGAKGILTDHSFYATAALEGLTLGELPSYSGAISTVKGAQCVVDLLGKEILSLRQKSCGKCVFCREGLYQLAQAAEEMACGRAKPQDLDLCREIAGAMVTSCNCTLGDQAGLPMLTALSAFPAEVEAHVRRKECPAGVCLALTQFYIDPKKCQGCGQCADACPAGCIESKAGFVSVIDSFDCTRCGKCLTACPNGAVVKASGRIPKLPDRPTRVKGAKAAAPEAAAPEAPKERTGAKRKRSFGKPTGGAAPVREAAPAPAAPPAQEKPAPAEEKPGLKTVGKRKRVYAKPKTPTGES